MVVTNARAQLADDRGIDRITRSGQQPLFAGIDEAGEYQIRSLRSTRGYDDVFHLRRRAEFGRVTRDRFARFRQTRRMGITRELVLDRAVDSLDHEVGWVKTKRLRIADVEIDNAASLALECFRGPDHVADGVEKGSGTF